MDATAKTLTNEQAETIAGEARALGISKASIIYRDDEFFPGAYRWRVDLYHPDDGGWLDTVSSPEDWERIRTELKLRLASRSQMLHETVLRFLGRAGTMLFFRATHEGRDYGVSLLFEPGTPGYPDAWRVAVNMKDLLRAQRTSYDALKHAWRHIRDEKETWSWHVEYVTKARVTEGGEENA